MSSIRPARAGDATALGELHVAAWQAAYGGIVAAAYLHRLDPARKAAGWRSRAADPKPGRHVLVHQGTGGDVDGVVHFGGGEVHALYVHPQRQRRGIGSALLAAAEVHLAALGPGRLELWTFAENAPGLAFFGARGWTPDGGTGTWLLGDRRCAEVRLVKTATASDPRCRAVLTVAR
jgi:GNAT superfamily N-acetyltransferase